MHATGIRFVLYNGSVSAEAKKPFKNLILLKTNISHLWKKENPRRVFFLLQDFGAVFFFSAKFPMTISSGSALCRKGIAGRFCTSRYGAGQRLCGEPRHGKGWVWPLTLDIASQ